MKLMQIDNSVQGSILTIIISIIGLNEIDIISKIVFMSASSITCVITTMYTYKKMKNIKNEKINK